MRAIITKDRKLYMNTSRIRAVSWANSSVGQSARFTSVRSQVRALFRLLFLCAIPLGLVACSPTATPAIGLVPAGGQIAAAPAATATLVATPIPPSPTASLSATNVPNIVAATSTGAVKAPTATRRPTTPEPGTGGKGDAPKPTLNPAITPGNMNLSEIFRGPTGRKYVALTFDAGGGTGNPALILKTLRERNQKLTFFLTGLWVAQNPAYARQIAADGHEIANHTYSHPDLTTLSDAEVTREITLGAQTIAAGTGVTPTFYFRSPYGAENRRTITIANNLGYRPVFWTLDTLDSVGEPKSADFLINRVRNQSDTSLDGGIILIHVGNLTSAQALGAILDNFKARSFTVVTLSQMMGQ